MHDAKLPENVLNCVSSIKKRILEEPTTPIPQIYDQQVKKFRRDNGSAATVPVFDSIRQSLYYTRLSVLPELFQWSLGFRRLSSNITIIKLPLYGCVR
ncbi:unnamed protein product [Didymodactylos carnosus]|uniref:Uncharacterized protein n=1 Tax=Didymodactylos carnosus TaxID=1234261 RepID=A0A8S2XX64_9BILA|nr:unnamed protein product [Didymodactylos carnosus]